MTHDEPSNERQRTNDSAEALDREAWKHFASSGATDKHTMITTVTWFLGFGAALVAYIVTKLIESRTPPRLTYPGQTIVISIVGLTIALLAAYVTLLYGGYANRNWAAARRIACRRNWTELVPEFDSRERVDGSLASRAWMLARHHNPETELPGIFLAFWRVSLAMIVTNLALLIWAIAALARAFFITL